jgi:hypothetical protein
MGPPGDERCPHFRRGGGGFLFEFMEKLPIILVEKFNRTQIFADEHR